MAEMLILIGGLLTLFVTIPAIIMLLVVVNK